MKTSVGNSRRSDSAEASREPSSSADLPAPAASFTLTWCGTPARESLSPTIAALSPERIIRVSVRVRGEKPCVPRCIASSRFVLPAPLSPTTSTIPGESTSSSEAYERKSRSVTSRTTSAAAVSPRAGSA